jgi:hypothetical protein
MEVMVVVFVFGMFFMDTKVVMGFARRFGFLRVDEKKAYGTWLVGNLGLGSGCK